MKIAKVVCVVLASLMVGVVAKGGPVRWVMPWMCLERCNGTTASIEANLRQLAAHSNSLSAVSYEMYNLGDGEKLVLNPLARVTENISALGLTTIPMISSYPYPPQFLDWMRQVFASPQSFETEAIAQMVQHGFAGFNVDWEPTDKTVSPSDPIDYARFLDSFSSAMHQRGGIVSVDTATWSPLWNYTMLGETALDYIMTMATYTDSPTSFEEQLQKAVAAIPAEKLVVGLETVKASSGDPYSTAEIQAKFELLKKYNVQAIGLWKMPIPDNWWPFVDAFARGD